LKSNVTPIPKTKKAAKPKAEKVQAAVEIPKDLADIWSAITAIATAHKLLQEGHFTYAHRNAVGIAIAFLEQLHGNALSDAAAHPQKHLIPEIEQLLASRKAQDEQAKNAEAAKGDQTKPQ